MSKFNVGDRVLFKWHNDADTGIVCEAPQEYREDDHGVWVKWNSDRKTSPTQEHTLTLILPARFKIDVQDYANKNGISLEEAHNEIQPWLFGHGFNWGSNQYRAIMGTNLPYLLCRKDNKLEVTDGEQIFSFNLAYIKQVFLFRNVSVHLSIMEDPQEEIIEILSKKYRKSDVEKALQFSEYKE